MKDSIVCCPLVAKIFLVFLRITIGWHLLYEGIYKFESQGTEEAWSAEGYLRNATGPFKDRFKKLVGVELAVMDQQSLESEWRSYVDQAYSFYGMTAEQREQAEEALNLLKAQTEAEVFEEPETAGMMDQHRTDIVKKQEEAFLSTSEQTRLVRDKGQLSSQLYERTLVLKEQIYELLSPEQQQKGKKVPVTSDDSMIGQINTLVIWGLIGGGACLLVGLFSRLAALGSASLLLLFYIAMPPFPGLPAMAQGAGHYLYVNNNLIEAIALLVLATTGCGRWCGLDAIIRSTITGPLFGLGRNQEEPE